MFFSSDNFCQYFCPYILHLQCINASLDLFPIHFLPGCEVLNKLFVLTNAKSSFTIRFEIAAGFISLLILDFRCTKQNFHKGQLTSPKSSLCHFFDINKTFLNLQRLSTATFSFKCLQEK